MLYGFTFTGTSVDLSPFSLGSLLPSDRSKYYRYSGSLTTPPCYESVIWTVMEETIKISTDQVHV